MPGTQLQFGSWPIMTFAKAAALSLGFFCAYVLWGSYMSWQSGDSALPNSERIAIVTQTYDLEGAEPRTLPLSARPLGKSLQDAGFPFETLGQIGLSRPTQMQTAYGSAMAWGSPADLGALETLNFEILSGDLQDTFSTSGKIVLTDTLANDIFGTTEVINERVSIGGLGDVRIGAVIRLPPQPSQFGSSEDSLLRVDYFHNWGLVDATIDDEWWLSGVGYTYVLLPDHFESEAVTRLEEQLRTHAVKVIPAEQIQALEAVSFGLQPLNRYLFDRLDRQIFEGREGLFDLTTLMVTIASIMLLIACFNCSFLTIEQTLKSEKETGLRKALGQRDRSIILQQWYNTIWLTVIAAGLSLLFVFFLRVPLEAIIGVDPWSGLGQSLTILPFSVLAVLLVSSIIAVIPAIYLANIQPARALTPLHSTPSLPTSAYIMVGLQHWLSSSLIIVSLIVLFQNQWLEKQTALTPLTEIYILKGSTPSNTDSDLLRLGLSGQEGFIAVSHMSYLPWSDPENYQQHVREGRPLSETVTAMRTDIGFDFFKVFDAPILAGRSYDPDLDQYENTPAVKVGPKIHSLVIDADMSKALGFESPETALGEHLQLARQQTGVFDAKTKWTIIGVVETPALMIGRGDVRANIFPLRNNLCNGSCAFPVLKSERAHTANLLTTAGRIEGLSDQGFQPLALSYEDLFQTRMTSFDRLGWSMSAIAIIACLIAISGAIAMAAFIGTAQRHAVGVKKTLGATSRHIVLDFLAILARPIIVAQALSWLTAYFISGLYLAIFMSRGPFSIAPWLIGFILTFGITILILTYQSYRASRARPYDTLRYE